MKKRNKKFLQEKDFLRLKKAERANYTAQRNLGWIELDKPVQDGFIAKLQLRDDVANRQDAWVFQNILDNFGSTAFAKRMCDFNFNDIRKNKLTGIRRPHINSIPEHMYVELTSQEQKYFTLSSVGYGWYSNYYYCTIPDFYFVLVFDKHYRTRVQITDEVLLQEEAEIRSELERNHVKRLGYRKGYCTSEDRRHIVKKQRAESKRILHNILYEKSEKEFLYNHKVGIWNYNSWCW